MAVNKVNTTTNMGNGATANRIHTVVNTPLTITGWTNGSSYAYETLSTSGVDITSAINSSGWGGCVSNSIALTDGHILRIKFNLTLNSGTLPTVRLVVTTTGVGSGFGGQGTVQAKAGANEIFLTAVGFTLATAYIEISSTVNTNFSITGFSADTQAWTLVSNTVAYDYFRNNAVVGDAIVFSGYYGTQIPHNFWFEVGTALAAASITARWSYTRADIDKLYIENTSYNSFTWADLTVTDNTNTFQTAGQNTITFTPPSDMGFAFCTPLSGYMCWFIRCEITAVSGITEGGANASNASKVAHNSIDIVGGYANGTITSTTEISGRTYLIYDTTKSWTPRELEGRYFWLATGNGSPKCWMIRTNGTNYFYVGLCPQIQIPQGANLSMVANPAAGDSYVISHTMEDIRLADVAGSWGLVTASDWINQWKKYRNYYFKASIRINPSSATNWSLLSAWGENISFNLSYAMGWAGTYWAAGRLALGLRDINCYDKDGNYSLNDEVSYLGCHISVNNYSYANPTMYIYGFINGSLFTNTTKSSFTQTIHPHGEWYNNILSCTQIQNYAAELTGKTLIHFTAEPNRNPIAGLFKLTDFRTSNGAMAYCVGAANYYLDSPYSSYIYSLQSYNQFVSGYYCDIIDKNKNTPIGFNIALAAGTTSGMFRLYNRLNIKVVDKDGTAIGGASISVVDKNGISQFTDTTTASGNATNNSETGIYPAGNKCLYGYKQTATAGYSTTLTDTNSPFTLTISKEGYETYTCNLTMDKREDLIVELKDAVPVMTTTDSRAVVKLDPTNSGVNRGIGIVI